jgi:hypothetical protein
MKSYTFLLFLLLVFPVANALTGSIGNAKAIVSVTLDGDSKVIDREILVLNVNNESVKVKLEPKDDFETIATIFDKEFILQPNEEKKARYQITVKEPGIYNGQIVVLFEAMQGKSPGVALPSTIILKVFDKDGNLPGEVDIKVPETGTNKTIENKITGGASVNVGGNGEDNSSGNWIKYVALGLFIIIIVCVVVFFVRML